MMARLTIEDCWWTDPRRERLAEHTGSLDLADIVAVKAWRLAQEFWKQGRGLVPQELFDRLKHAAALLDIGLAVLRTEGVYVRGSSAYLDWLREQKEIARAAGKKSAEVRRVKHGSAQPKKSKNIERNPNVARTKSNDVEPSVSVSVSVFDSDSVSDSDSGTDSELIARGSKKSEDGGASKGGDLNPDGASATALVWRAYRDAFEKKHGSKPPWNAKTAGQLKSFVSRIPAAAAPAVAAFYLTHPGARYAAAMHPVGLLLMDAEKLYTEWQTGKTVTGTGARQAEKFGHAADQIRRIREGTL